MQKPVFFVLLLFYIASRNDRDMFLFCANPTLRNGANAVILLLHRRTGLEDILIQ